MTRPPLPNRKPGRPSERERIEVLIRKGLSNKQITERLGCSVSTANKWRQEIKTKGEGA